jgi:hypothetical protein
MRRLTTAVGLTRADSSLDVTEALRRGRPRIALERLTTERRGLLAASQGAQRAAQLTAAALLAAAAAAIWLT